MKARLSILAVISLMGMTCQQPAGPTTVSVEYVNNTGLSVVFNITDATNTLVANYSMTARDFTNPADPVTTVTGVLPMIVTIPFINQAASCGIPSITGINPSQDQLVALVNGKVVRIEATNNQTLECAEENP